MGSNTISPRYLYDMTGIQQSKNVPLYQTGRRGVCQISGSEIKIHFVYLPDIRKIWLHMALRYCYPISEKKKKKIIYNDVKTMTIISSNNVNTNTDNKNWSHN